VSSATNAREVLIADSQFGAGAQGIFAPGTWHLGLSTTVSAEDGTGFTEPSGSSYARAAILNNATNFPPASTADGTTKKTNGTKFTMPVPSGSWGQILEYGFFTGPTGGTVQWRGTLDSPINPRSGNNPVEFDIGQIVITFD
jgi:hypothetical protein